MGGAWKKRCAKSCATRPRRKAHSAKAWVQRSLLAFGTLACNPEKKSRNFVDSLCKFRILRNDHSGYQCRFRADAPAAGSSGLKLAGPSGGLIDLDNFCQFNGVARRFEAPAGGPPPR